MNIFRTAKILRILMIIFFLIPVISCSGNDKQKSNSPVRKIVGKKTETAKDEKVEVVSDITCAKCHKSDDKGNLIFPQGGNEGAKPEKNSGSAH